MRTTPIHLLFPEGDVDRQRLADILSEAERAGIDSWNPLAMAALPGVAAWVSELRPGDQEPQAVHAYSALVFYAAHALGAHGQILEVNEGVGRALGSSGANAETTNWSGQPYSAAGYAQLPHNLFWVQTRVEAEGADGEAGALAEPLDGIFWASTPGEPAARGGLWVMLAAGIRPGRPGFNAIALDRLPLADVAQWVDADMRGDGTDFENLLPGGDLAGFLTLGTTGESLKLLSRVWRHAELFGVTAGEADATVGLSFHTLNTHSG